MTTVNRHVCWSSRSSKLLLALTLPIVMATIADSNPVNKNARGIYIIRSLELVAIAVVQ
jgi:hypothetical protein